MSALPAGPKHQLLGLTLPSGWKIEEVLSAPNGASGGYFGVGYKASRNGSVAFVKALDFVDALRSQDPMAEFASLTRIALFERDVLQYCQAKGMTKVLSYLGHEYVWVGDQTNPLNQVSCLLLEAGAGDLRHALAENPHVSCAWNIQVARDVAQALAQLHAGAIAHQDIKPANVIAFGDLKNGAGGSMKVGDLGRVTRKDAQGPFDASPWPGDFRYSPPERWYGHVPADWNDAREAADAYMLGSLIFYVFTGVSIQAAVSPRIPSLFAQGAWRGLYDDDLIPVLSDATTSAVLDLLKPAVPDYAWEELSAIVLSLTHPDPRRRGDKRARQNIGKPVGLDRIHQRLANLAVRCTAIERGMRAK